MTNINPQQLLEQIQNQLMTLEERQAHHAKIKSESYMRWLAFYYLGRREHSQKELREKLLAKDCNPDAVDSLLQEFIQEGYQSDERMTSALIKEGILKKHGTIRICQTLKKHGLTTLKSPTQINTWIQEHPEFFNDLLVNDIEHDEPDEETQLDNNYEVDWLAQAVEARVRKYGNTIPTHPKDKAKQLRFLQYRGFSLDTSFEALKYNQETLAHR